jgi:soluble lytic murein transglycosylase-like protein
MDPEARSHAGAQGLLQVMPATAAELGADASVPAANVLAGSRYLERMIDRFGDQSLALAAYNAGPSAVERAGGAPTNETLAYVANVQARQAALSACG